MNIANSDILANSIMICINRTQENIQNMNKRSKSSIKRWTRKRKYNEVEGVKEAVVDKISHTRTSLTEYITNNLFKSHVKHSIRFIKDLWKINHYIFKRLNTYTHFKFRASSSYHFKDKIMIVWTNPNWTV